MAAKNVLVTGGAGFIGSHVADAYIKRGDRVWIVDDLSTGREHNIPQQAEFLQASIHETAAADLFKKVRFDVFSHHAAQVDVRKSVSDPRHDARINLDGLLNLLEAARQTGVKRVLFVSSGGVVYGEPEQRPTPETAPKLPLSPYGVSKLAAEFYLHYYHRIHGLDYVAVRYGNVYGPRQDPHGEAGVIAIFCERIIERTPLTVYGDGQQTRDYVFVGDIVSANMVLSDAVLAPSSSLDQRAFNVGTGVETSVLELARTLSSVAATAPSIVHEAERRGELRRSCLDVRKLKSFGWQPARTLREGLSITYEYIRSRENR